MFKVMQVITKMWKFNTCKNQTDLNSPKNWERPTYKNIETYNEKMNNHRETEAVDVSISSVTLNC